jgi:hypothetical protein
MWDYRALKAVRTVRGPAAAQDIIDPDRTLRFNRPVLEPAHYYQARERMTAALTNAN